MLLTTRIVLCSTHEMCSETEADDKRGFLKYTASDVFRLFDCLDSELKIDSGERVCVTTLVG